MTTMTILRGKSTSTSIILWTCLAYLCASIQADTQNINVSINPSGETTVRTGQNLTILCSVGVPLKTCRVEVPQERSVILEPNQPSEDGIGWYGSSLDAGQCGVFIAQIKEKHDGIFKCSLTPKNARYESYNTLRIIVAKPPVMPELMVFPGRRGERQNYEKGETLKVSCRVKAGRPVANVSIFFGDEQIGLEERPIVYNYNNDSYVIQNATRVLSWTDNGKVLRCDATHLALDRPLSAKQQISVLYAPQPQPTIERFGFVIGQPGTVNVTVQANPRPQFMWRIDDDKVDEGQFDESNRIRSSRAVELGKGYWEITLNIDSVQKSDTEKKYVLLVNNELGSTEYQIVLSTSTEPAEGISNRTTSPHAHAGAFSHFYGDLDAGSIIGIVVGVLILLLIVFLIIFARATGRWCFAGGSSTRTIGESDIADPAASVSLLRFRKPKPDDPNAGRRSDTESAGRYSRSEVDSSASAARRARAKMNFSQLFKRNKDKVSGTDTDTVRTVVTVDDEKIQTSDAPQAVTLNSANPAVGEGGLVYAELDLTQQKNVAPRRIDDDATEYAEIIYTKPEAEEAANAANK
ncbi:fasciclin-3 isoform X2 [Neodiprion fabricii]|uniref:fasciclin-3 isoform X2 n=1 Tax=Neodiprion fabricii TaxID=2872261 RepID=UPI001ED8EE08|nr:fasciclin-3 isoform X2 [Neodiprion fabricii]